MDSILRSLLNIGTNCQGPVPGRGPAIKKHWSRQHGLTFHKSNAHPVPFIRVTKHLNLTSGAVCQYRSWISRCVRISRTQEFTA